MLYLICYLLCFICFTLSDFLYLFYFIYFALSALLYRLCFICFLIFSNNGTYILTNSGILFFCENDLFLCYTVHFACRSLALSIYDISGLQDFKQYRRKMELFFTAAQPVAAHTGAKADRTSDQHNLCKSCKQEKTMVVIFGAMR